MREKEREGEGERRKKGLKLAALIPEPQIKAKLEELELLAAIRVALDMGLEVDSARASLAAEDPDLACIPEHA